MLSKKVLATMLLLIFALPILLSAIPVRATVSGILRFVKPNIVAPGGPICVDASDLEATGGTVYFYLSTNDDPEISSGDVYFTSVKTVDLSSRLTLWIPSTITKNETYHVKAKDLKQTGPVAVVTADTFDVPLEWPTVTIDPVDGIVTDEPTIEGKGAEDYETFEFYWTEYDTADYGPFALVEGEFTVEDYAIPHDFEGSHNIIVLFTDAGGDTLATAVGFTIKPDVVVTPPEDYSVRAESTTDQIFTIEGTGFPEGTVDADSTVLIVKNFRTGSTIDTYSTVHIEKDVSDVAGSEGDLTLDVTLEEYVEAGAVTLKINVDGKIRTFEDVFYASKPITDAADFTAIEFAKASPTEGYMGDDIDFSAINLPADASIDVSFEGPITRTVVTASLADGNGAWKFTWEDIADLPGGTYNVRAWVRALGKTVEDVIATFKVLPEFEIWDPVELEKLDETQVGDEVMLHGTGFPKQSTIKTALFATEKVDVVDTSVGNTGVFEITLMVEDDEEVALVVPHISGGGKSVTVTVKGNDTTGKEISAITDIKIIPRLLWADEDDWEVGVLEWVAGEYVWTDFDLAPDVFPGNPVKIVGFGYLSGESVSVKLFEHAGDLIGTYTITSGAKADSSGDLELVCLTPVVKAIYPGGNDDVDIKVAGSTDTNNATMEDFYITASDDLTAKIFFGLEDDGDLDTDVNVADTARVVGCGFRTRTLTLMIDDTEVKTVTDGPTTNGYFDVTIVIPEMEGSWDPDLEEGKEYTLSVDETGTAVSLWLVPKITLDPSEGSSGQSFTVKGTAFNDANDVDIVWVGITEETLDTVDKADIEDGSFEISVKAPATVAAAYKVRAEVAGDEWASATFVIGDPWRLEVTRTLNNLTRALNSLSGTVDDLSAAVETLNVEAITAAIDAVKRDISTLGTTVDTLKGSVSTATDTATAAKDAATAAETAATNAASAASDAKAAAQAAQSTAAGISTAVYGAMALSAIAAIAAIVAVIFLQRKVAG